jgi:uncharacterized protein YnzC (UPF0291/DUF896 family)
MGTGRSSNAVEALERHIREALLENQAVSRKHAKRKETGLTDFERPQFLEILRSAYTKAVADRAKAQTDLDKLKIIVGRVNPDNEEEYHVCMDAETQSVQNLAKFNIVVADIERLKTDVMRGR